MLSLQLDVNIPDTIPNGHPLGIDLGLDKFLATSDGELINRPRFFNTLHRKLKLLQRRLKNKRKGSSNWLKLNQKIARVHQTISDTRKDWQFKLAHHLCDRAGMIFAVDEVARRVDINFISWAKGMFGKHTLDASFGQFINLLKWVCWKRGVYFAQVDKNYTSQTCPNCGAHTGKKLLKEREHNCPECHYRTHRDTAAAQVIRDKGISALGHSVEVKENVLGEVLTGISSNANLVKTQRVRKSKERSLEARA